MARATYKSIGLTKTEIANLKSWRNGWGTRLWKAELRRLWKRGPNALDTLYCDDIEVMKELQSKLEPHLDTLNVAYDGPDPD